MSEIPQSPSQNSIFSLLRADDLLALTFELINLKLLKTPKPPRLVRNQPGDAAYIIVHFPPQHIAEQVFDDPNKLPDIPIQSVLADTSRLAFRVPDNVKSIPFTFSDLLTWTQFDLSEGPNVLKEPELQVTAIEVPYRLILKPLNSMANLPGWKHAMSVVTRNGNTELWHTRLGIRQGTTVDDTRLPPLRAVFARDFRDNFKSLDTEPSTDIRKAIATSSSNIMNPKVEVKRLMLSSLGAWAQMGGTWPQARDALLKWQQLISMGRDQHESSAEPGFLFPFGFRASQLLKPTKIR